MAGVINIADHCLRFVRHRSFRVCVRRTSNADICATIVAYWPTNICTLVCIFARPIPIPTNSPKDPKQMMIVHACVQRNKNNMYNSRAWVKPFSAQRPTISVHTRQSLYMFIPVVVRCNVLLDPGNCACHNRPSWMTTAHVLVMFGFGLNLLVLIYKCGCNVFRQFTCSKRKPGVCGKISGHHKGFKRLCGVPVPKGLWHPGPFNQHLLTTHDLIMRRPQMLAQAAWRLNGKILIRSNPNHRTANANRTRIAKNVVFMVNGKTQLSNGRAMVNHRLVNTFQL